MSRWLTLTALLTVSVWPTFAADVELDGLKSKTPASWKEAKVNSSMRRAQFVVDKEPGDSENGEIVVFFFGKGQGGGVEENLKRWKSQFKEPAGEKAKVETFKVGNVQVTYLDLQGTFLSKVPPFDPNAKTVEKPNYRALNAVFASPNGPYFIRFSGPNKTVEAHKKEFDDWLKNFK